MRRAAPWAAIALAATVAAGCAGAPAERGDEQRSAAALYAEARESLRNGAYSMAIEDFEDLVARYPFGEHALQSQLMIVYAHYRAGQHASAVAAADRFIRMHPRNEHVAYALYMRGVARQAMGPGGLASLVGADPTLRDPEPKRRAFADYRRLVAEHPDSEYVADAQRRMEAIRTELAAYELHVARFYYRREAYLAAAKRARAVVGRFPGTPSVPEAMGLLADAYRGLELEGLGEAVERERERLDDPPAPPTPG